MKFQLILYQSIDLEKLYKLGIWTKIVGCSVRPQIHGGSARHFCHPHDFEGDLRTNALSYSAESK